LVVGNKIPIFAAYLNVNYMDIKNIAREKGMRIEDIANKMGITKGGLSKALNGNPTIGTLRKVADVLQVPVTDFFRDEIGDAPGHIIEPQQKCPYCGHDLNIKVE
jgi:transcriptional regulator with XRE-family HTH domain